MYIKLVVVIVSFFLFKAGLELLPQDRLQSKSYPTTPEVELNNTPGMLAEM